GTSCSSTSSTSTSTGMTCPRSPPDGGGGRRPQAPGPPPPKGTTPDTWRSRNEQRKTNSGRVAVRQPGRRERRAGDRRRHRAAPVGSGQQPDQAAAHAPRALPGDHLRLGADRPRLAGVPGGQAAGAVPGGDGLRHRERGRARADAGRQRRGVRGRQGWRQPLGGHPHRPPLRAGGEPVRRAGVRASHLLHPATPVRADVRCLRGGPRRHRDGPGDADGLAAPPGEAPGPYAPDPDRSDVARPDRLGAQAPAGSGPSAGQPPGLRHPGVPEDRRGGDLPDSRAPGRVAARAGSMKRAVPPFAAVRFRRLAAGALMLLAAGCAGPGAGLRSGVEVLATDIYHSLSWSANLPVKAVIPVAVRRVVKSFVADLEVPDEVKRRLTERIDRAEFTDSTVPFLYGLSQLYTAKPETETFEKHVRAGFADLRSTPGFEHTLFHWDAKPPAGEEEAKTEATPAPDEDKYKAKAVVMAGLVMIFDALFLQPGGDPLRIHDRRSPEVIARAAAIVTDVLRSIAAQLPETGRLRGDLLKLAADTEHIEALTISMGDLIGDLSYGSFQRYLRLQKRKEELRD